MKNYLVELLPEFSDNATAYDLTKPTEPERFVPRFTEQWRLEAWDSWKPPRFMEWGVNKVSIE